MYKLSNLPLELIYIICDYLDTEDLLVLARLNNWYGYHLSMLLSERISHFVKHDGWKIHIDILAKCYHPGSASALSSELLLLGEYARINPYTLTLEFNLCPITEDGLDPKKVVHEEERSIVLLRGVKTNIDIVGYFAQISKNHRLQHINQAGASIMNHRQIWKDKPFGILVMGSGFKIKYDIINNHHTTAEKIVDKFKLDYKKQFDTDIANESIVASFNTVRVSPEWWLKQMEIPNHEPEINFFF